MCMFPHLFLDLLSIICFQNLETSSIQGHCYWAMTWNMKASIPVPYRCPPQPWSLAQKKAGIAENNSTILDCQQIADVILLPPFLYTLPTGEVNRNGSQK